MKEPVICAVCGVAKSVDDITLVQGTAMCAGCLEMGLQKARQAKRLALRLSLVMMAVMFGLPTLVCLGCLASRNKP